MRVKPQRIPMPEPIRFGPATQNEIDIAIETFHAQGKSITHLKPQNTTHRLAINPKKSSDPYESIVPKDLLL